MMLGDNAGQAQKNEKVDSENGVRKKRIEIIGFAVMGSIVPVVFILGQVTGMIEPIDFESLFSGLDIPWP